MIIDNKGKLFGKISIIDILVVLVILAAVAGVGYKFTKSKTASPFVKQDVIETVIFIEEVQETTAKSMKIGDIVKDGMTNSVFGQVKAVTLGPSRSYATTDTGEFKESAKPRFNSVEIVVEGKGIYSEAGVSFGNVDYYIGPYIDRLRIGNAGANFRPAYITAIRKR